MTKVLTSKGVVENNTDSVVQIDENEIQRIELKNQRDKSLSEIVHNFGDGRIVQVRPGDISTFQLAIQQGVGEDWVMQDNTVKFLSLLDLQTALDDGIAKGKLIWKEYTDSLKALNAEV
jgi:hypothetical protein